MVKEDSNKRYCDVCGSEIVGHYWAVEMGRRDWGSIEHFDACSTVCQSALYNRYVSSSNCDSGYFISKCANQPPPNYGISQKDWEEFWA